MLLTASSDLLTSSLMIRCESHYLYDLNLCTDCKEGYCPCVTLVFFCIKKKEWMLFGSLWPLMSVTIISQMVIPAQVSESLKCTACIQSAPCAFLPLYPPLNRADGGFMAEGGLCLQPLVFAFVYAQLPRLYPSSANWSTFLSIPLFVSSLLHFTLHIWPY